MLKVGERYFTLDIDGIDKYKIEMYGVRWNRKIFQPAEIEAEISIQTSESKKPTVAETVQLLLRKKVTFKTGIRGGDSKYAMLAKNYYIHEVLPQEKKDCKDKLFAKLSIFSMDKLMTLDKYSKVYVSRKLGSEILAEEIKNFKLSESENSNEDSTPDIEATFNNLNMLKYQFTRTLTNPMTGKTIDIQIPSEFIHPYLVQYNETFYDFMARTANRCGEFLYFEDGKLNLGLHKGSDDPEVISDYQTLTYQKVSSSLMDIGKYARDSMKEKNSTEQKTNYDVVKKNAAGYPNDAFPDHPSYNSELAADEYFFPLYADKFTTFEREMGFVGNDGDQAAHFLLPLLSSAAATASDIIDFQADLLMTESKTLGFANKSKNKKNEDGFSNYIEIGPTADRAKSLEKSNGKNLAVPFGTISADGWTTIDYFRDIRKYEEELQRDIVCIDLDTAFVNVKLGDKIRLSENGDLYVVIQIQIVNDIQWSRTYEKYGESASSKTEAKRNQKLFAIPCRKTGKGNTLADYQAYPPVLDAPVIRKAEPQTAFVTAYDDPKFQGRVRIVYPWQTESNGKLKELAEAEAAYAEEVRKMTEKKEQLAKIKAELEVLKNERADLELISKAATDDEKNKIIQKKKDEKDKAVKDLQNEIAAEQKIINDPKAKAEDKEEAKKKKANLEEQLKDQLKIKKEQEDYINLLEKSKTDDTILKNKIAEIEVKDKDGKLTGGKQKEYNDLLKEIKKAEGKDGSLTIAKNNVKNKSEKCSKAITAISSPWIRIATPMATEGGGVLFKPRAGDEVLVNYDSGNVERPYVIGSLFSKNVLEPDERINRTVGPALHSGASIAIVSPNGHGITFKDPGNAAGFASSAYPGLGVVSSYFGNWTQNLPKDSKDLAGGISIGDRYGLYSIDMSSDKRSIKIKSSMGTVTLNAFTGITISAPNGDVKIEGKNVTIKAGNNLSLVSGTNIATRSKRKKKVKDKDITLMDRLAVVEDMVLSRGLKEFITPFIDVSLARTLLEAVLRPVEGTATIKSHRYLKLEAGSGKAMIQHNRYTTKTIEGKTLALIAFIREGVLEINTKINSFCKDYQTKWSTGNTAVDTYKNNANEDNDPAKNTYLKTASDPSLNDIIDNAKILAKQAIGYGAPNSPWIDMDETALLFMNKLKDNISVQEKTDYLGWANGVAKEVYGLTIFTNSFNELYKAPKNLSDGIEKDVKDALGKVFLNLADDCKKKWEDYYDKNIDKFLTTSSPIPQDDIFAKAAILKRKWAGLFLLEVAKSKFAYKYILELHFKETDLTEKKLDTDWTKFVNTLNCIENPLAKTLVNDLTKPIKDILVPFTKLKQDREMWNENASGQILLSDDEACTVNFNKGKVDPQGNHWVSFDEVSNLTTIDGVKKALTALT